MKFKTGDKVKITRTAASHEANWRNAWVTEMNGAVGKIGTVVHYLPEHADVIIDVPGVPLRYGYPDFVLELANIPTPVVPARPAALNGQSVLEYARKTAVGLAAGNSSNRTNIDQVQSKLAKDGITPAMLGNSAGQIFKSANWQNTGLTIKSVRDGNRGRRIIVWQYVGPTATVPASSPVSGAVGPVLSGQKYIIEFAYGPGQHFMRSGNKTPDGRSLGQVEFTDLAEAQAEAARQSKNMGYIYRAVPVASPVNPPAPVPTGKFVVEVQNLPAGGWQRSINRYNGKNLNETEFSTQEDAEQAATQMRKFGSFPYRVVPAQSKKYIVQFKDFSGNWLRSGNFTTSGLDLKTHEFTSLAEAQTVAQEQERKSIGRTYRAISL